LRDKREKKNDLAEISKNLARYRFENNYVGNSSMMSNASKNFDSSHSPVGIFYIIILIVQ